jgi:hypothetical protein
MSAEPQLFRINPENRESEKITEVEFSHLGFQERRHIQEWIAANPGILGEDLLIIGKEFSGFDRTNERLDLLAVDEDGKLVVIELKRDHSGSDAHWQAIKYASYIHRARREDIIRMYASYANITESEAFDELLQHLGADDLSGLNNDQRIILASHRFAPEVTSASLWLNEKTDDEDLITCIQLIPYHDSQTDSLYIQANTIIPMPGAEEYSVGIGESQESDGVRSDLGTKLRRTFQRNRNDEVTSFLRNVANLAIDGLPDQIKPDRKSNWAVGSGNNPNDRRYNLWYRRPPWGNWWMFYSVHLFREDSSSTSSWRAEVGFVYDRRHFTDLSEDMERTLQDLGIHDGQTIFSGSDRRRSMMMEFDDGHSMDDTFANLLSDTLSPFIEAITPVIDEFEDERANEEAVP